MSQGLRRAFVTRARALKVAIGDPPWQPGGHFYSPIPSVADTRRALESRGLWVGVDLADEAQRALIDQLMPRFAEFDRVEGGRWRPNSMFGRDDAAVYWSLLHHLQPSRIVEIGSGFSTAVALDYGDLNGSVEVTAIEPYPERLFGLLRSGDEVHLIQKEAQDVPIEALVSGDILFIDSSHVAKAGSDVMWLLFDVLPQVPVGAWVHFHDVFWPRGYPDAWLTQRRAWNEAYMLRAFLMWNTSFRVRLFNSWLLQNHPPFGEACSGAPGSVWLQRVGE